MSPRPGSGGAKSTHSLQKSKHRTTETEAVRTSWYRRPTMSKPYQLACPVARSLEVVGDRWTLLIVRELLLEPLRYTQMQALLGGIPPNLLADRLRLLEDEGIVDRVEPRGYTLTDKGREIAPVLDALAVWGMRHYDEPPSALAHHRGCGGTVRLTHTCSACGATVDLADLDLVTPGEGRPR